MLRFLALAAIVVFFCPSIFSATVTFDLHPGTDDSPDIDVQVKVTDLSNGVKIQASILSPYIGDLRGIFFNLKSPIPSLKESDFSGWKVSDVDFNKYSTGGEIQTEQGYSFPGYSGYNGNNNNNVEPFGNFHVAIELGKNGISNNDDIRSATIYVSKYGLNSSQFVDVAARVMSIFDSYDCERDLSGKYTSTPEPTTNILAGSALGLLVLWRRRKLRLGRYR